MLESQLRKLSSQGLLQIASKRCRWLFCVTLLLNIAESLPNDAMLSIYLNLLNDADWRERTLLQCAWP